MTSKPTALEVCSRPAFEPCTVVAAWWVEQQRHANTIGSTVCVCCGKRLFMGAACPWRDILLYTTALCAVDSTQCMRVYKLTKGGGGFLTFESGYAGRKNLLPQVLGPLCASARPC